MSLSGISIRSGERTFTLRSQIVSAFGGLRDSETEPEAGGSTTWIAMIIGLGLGVASGVIDPSELSELYIIT